MTTTDATQSCPRRSCRAERERLADLERRMAGLLEQAADFLRKFDASRVGQQSDDAGDQFSYGVATGLYSSVIGLLVESDSEIISVSEWVAAGMPNDPRALVRREGHA